MKYTVLVNSENKLKKNYLDKIELIEIKNVSDEKIMIEKETWNAFVELKKHLNNMRVSIGIIRGYDSNLDDYSTGLALDIGILIDDKYICEYSEDTSSYFHKIYDCLFLFGFILRYPKDKESITGYSFNPCHIRYVGKIPSKIIYENHYTLEEYLKDFGAVLYVNKPKNVTSFDVVNEISHLFGIKRVGHTGTLDPSATGVLLVAIGKATKIVELLTAEDKEYVAGVKLGVETDTYDITGKVLDEKEVPNNLDISGVVESFQKTYQQEVPIYSAVKVNGKKLYDYARSQMNVVLPKKEVTIKEIELLERKNDCFSFRALVTKGCYIRSLIHDIGISLGTYATMTDLNRTKQGIISIEDTDTIEDILKGNFHIHSIKEVLSYPVVKVDVNLEKKLSSGMRVFDKWNITDKVIFENVECRLIGIYEKDGEYLRTWKNFV